MAYYQYKNILFEYQEFEDCVSIIDVRITQSTTNKVFKIPAEINGKPVTSFSHRGTYNVALYIKDCKDIIIPSTINNMCNIKCQTSLNIHVDSLDHYFKISNHLYFGRNSKLYINNSLITTLKLNPNISNIIINSLTINVIDCRDLMDSINVSFFECDINKIINTDNIKTIPFGFSCNTNWEKSLYFPNVTIIDTGSFILHDTFSIKLICPNLVFIETNIIYSKISEYILPTIHIKSDTKPIIYPQKYKINVNDCYTSGNN